MTLNHKIGSGQKKKNHKIGLELEETGAIFPKWTNIQQQPKKTVTN